METQAQFNDLCEATQSLDEAEKLIQRLKRALKFAEFSGADLTAFDCDEWLDNVQTNIEIAQADAADRLDAFEEAA